MSRQMMRMGIVGAVMGVGMSAAVAETASFYPDPVCVVVGQRLALGLVGAKYPGAGFWSDDETIAKTSVEGGRGFVTGKKVGQTKVRIGGKAELVTWGSAPVTVKKTLEECNKMYLGADVTVPVRQPGVTQFKFVFVSDTQGCSACVSKENIVDRDFAKWFAKRMTDVEKPAFIVHGGDLANYGPSADEWIDLMEPVFKDSKIPIYAAIGNHDLVRDALGRYVKEMQDEWQTKTWDTYFAGIGAVDPESDRKNAGHELLNLAYSFQYGNSLFLISDSEYMWGNAGTDASDENHMKVGEIEAKQLAWVAAHSVQAGKQGTNPIRHAFVFSHYPLLSGASCSKEENNQQLRSIMEGKSNLTTGRFVFDALFSGHKHDFEFYNVGATRQIIAGTGNGEVDSLCSATDKTKPCNAYVLVEVKGNTVVLTEMGQKNRVEKDTDVAEAIELTRKEWSVTSVTAR